MVGVSLMDEGSQPATKGGQPTKKIATTRQR